MTTETTTTETEQDEMTVELNEQAWDEYDAAKNAAAPAAPGGWYDYRECDTIYCATDGSIWIVASQDWAGLDNHAPERLDSLPAGAVAVPEHSVDEAIISIADEIEAEVGHCADCDGPCKGH